jgi:DNA invertase Pin-like site-specific DNA recombinase
MEVLDTVATIGSRGATIRSLSDDVDTGTTEGEHVLHVFASVTEIERDLERERSASNLVAARIRGRAQGRAGGRPRAMTPEQERAARVMHTRDSLSFSQIAEVLGFSRSTVYRAIDRDSL